MNVYVSVISGVNVTAQLSTPPQYTASISRPTTTVSVSQPITSVSSVPVFQTGNADVIQWATNTFYPLTNPSGFASGIDASAFVRYSETGQFYSNNNPSGFIANSKIIKFQTILNSGEEASQILYPNTLTGLPMTVNCEVENNIDNFIYSYAISSVNISGFIINWSDILYSSGYILYTTINT